jgi:MoxR-like ATPase
VVEERVLIDARDVAHALWVEIRGAMVEIDRPASLALCCLLAAGHLLVEDVPGVGKTTLAKVIAHAIGGHDSRIQCTEDLTSAAVIGQEIESTNPALRPDEFIPGPLFANAVVLDEFNRATPRMQSGLLEAMEEHAVTVGKRRHALPKPFFCIGTMNPHDAVGTFEMPHASSDRFSMRTGIGYPSEVGERDLLERFGSYDPRNQADPIVAPGDVVQLQKVIAELPASDAVRAYLVRLLRSTRDHPDVLVGASPRALLSMFRCTQAAALLDNAAEVAVKHVRSLFEPCIAHRLRVRPDASARAICEEILERTPVPVTTPPPSIAASDGRPRPSSAQVAA